MTSHTFSQHQLEHHQKQYENIALPPINQFCRCWIPRLPMHQGIGRRGSNIYTTGLRIQGPNPFGRLGCLHLQPPSETATVFALPVSRLSMSSVIPLSVPHRLLAPRSALLLHLKTSGAPNGWLWLLPNAPPILDRPYCARVQRLSYELRCRCASNPPQPGCYRPQTVSFPANTSLETVV